MTPPRLWSAFLWPALAAALLAGPSHAGANAPPGSSAPVASVAASTAPASESRPVPPKAGRTRCINVDSVAGAVVIGDAAVELTMKSGKRWKMYFDRGCPALSFYQGFYYRRAHASQLCAGRDAVIARSGGECAIASIMPLPKAKIAR
jgi:hypothetical protein